METGPHQTSAANTSRGNGQSGTHIAKCLPVRCFILEHQDTPTTQASLKSKCSDQPEEWQEAVSVDKRSRIGFFQRVSVDGGAQVRTTLETGTLIIGDLCEWNVKSMPEAMGNAARVHFDMRAGTFSITASITGLPPLYIWQIPGRIIVTSDLYLLAFTLGTSLSFDPEGIADFCCYGYPVNHRTLFRNVRLCAGATRLTITADGQVKTEKSWTFPNETPISSWADFTELQARIFQEVLQRMDLSSAFLSLTAGLDTRTILSALVATGRGVPALTMTGRNWTVDARVAHSLCKAYGIQHEAVLLDDEFLRSLPELSREACRLSGGLASLEQSHEVYLYRKVGRAFTARLSGNMGNQLGRKGVEHVSMRAADPGILNSALKSHIQKRAHSPWYKQGLKTLGIHEFLLQHEALFTLVGNFSIGNHFAVQQTPYASRALFELCPRQPLQANHDGPASALSLRFNDLRHRFFGVPEERSFQRRLIHEKGGVAATYPINWGWRAKGGVSPVGVGRGLFSLLDALAVRQGLDGGLIGNVLNTLRLTGVHEFRRWKLWMRSNLRDFVHDELLSNRVRQSGLFDESALQRALGEHYSDKADHHRELVLALDLALAVQEFGAKVA
jgi:asparagine synthetase B (glutamine-hydrolysing)